MDEDINEVIILYRWLSRLARTSSYKKGFKTPQLVTYYDSVS